MTVSETSYLAYALKTRAGFSRIRDLRDDGFSGTEAVKIVKHEVVWRDFEEWELRELIAIADWIDYRFSKD